MIGSTAANERRASPRVDEVQLVQVGQLGSRALTTGRTLNLSRGGVRLEMSKDLPLRTRVRLSLAVGDEFVTVDGAVVYLEALDGRRCSMGVQFTELDAGSRGRLDAYVARHARRA
ncbi:MAG: PilZ domain-containing protein [Thermoanaerobaculia bacterium]